MKVKDLIRNPDFDVCAFIEIYACDKYETWTGCNKPVFCGFPEDLIDNTDIWEKPIKYITINFDNQSLVIEIPKD